MMKKTSLRFFVLLVLAVSMMLTVLPVSAAADFTVTYRVGQNVGKAIVYGSVDGEITSATIDSGELPPGMSMSKDKTSIYLSGTPTLGGIYICSLSVNTEWGTEIVEVRVDVLDSETTPTPAPANDPPKITKNPTGETVEVGGSAMFIARADNAEKIVWRLVSADTTNTVPAEDGPAYFSGLQVSGTGTETLVLSNIPKSLNGWCAECKFVNSNGTSFTTGAIITVKDKAAATTTTPSATASPTPSTGNVKAPVINTQPRGVNQTVGSGATLSVKAISTDGGTLSYQWYSSTEADSGNLTEISGETGSSFTPPQTEGTVYYCVSVVNTKDGKQSDPVYSNKAAVTYAQPTVPSQSPTESTQPDGAASPSPDASATPRPSDGGSDGMSMTTSLIFFGVTGVLALAALIVIIIFLKKSAKGE